MSVGEVLAGTSRHHVEYSDCFAHLVSLDPKKVSAVITDPPYGIAHKSHGQIFARATPIDGDGDTQAAEKVYDWCAGNKVPLAMFFSPYRWLACSWRSVLVWDKGEDSGIGGDRATCWKRDVEMIGVAFNRKLNGQRDSCVLRYRARMAGDTGHFAEKPIPLMRYLVEKLSPPGGLVIDPFCGTATTGIACLQTGRRFLGFEIDERWAKVSKNRLAEEEGRYPLFDATPIQTEMWG